MILPTYNERATIATVLDGLAATGADLDVLVVDDGSPDGTGQIVRERSETDPHLRLVERPRKSGLASAYAVGFERAISEGYDLAVEMDSDLSHRPDELPRLLEAAARHHLVIGSRYVAGGSVTNWSRSRVALSKAGNLYARFCLGFDVHDATSGFRVYRSEALEEIIAAPIASDGYGFQIELVYRASNLGLSVGEAPDLVPRARARPVQDQPPHRGGGALARHPVGAEGTVPASAGSLNRPTEDAGNARYDKLVIVPYT